jgi:hypothetical protein
MATKFSGAKADRHLRQAFRDAEKEEKHTVFSISESSSSSSQSQSKQSSSGGSKEGSKDANATVLEGNVAVVWGGPKTSSSSSSLTSPQSFLGMLAKARAKFEEKN